MKWKLFANLAEAVGDREVTLELDSDATIEDALDDLLASHPELESEVLDDDGDLYDHIRILHNGSSPFEDGAGLETPVEDDDELALFPPVSGG